MQTYSYRQHNSTLIDRMVRVVRDNREAMQECPIEVADLVLASMQLAQMAKALMEDAK